MARAFIEQGVWRMAPARELETPSAQRRTTLRASLAAALATLAIAGVGDLRAPSEAAPKPVVIARPEIVIVKTEERVPSMGETLSPFRRRLSAPEASAELPAVETTAALRALPQPREAAVAEGGMISAEGATYRLAGIMLPESGRVCRRLDGLSVNCFDRAQSYLELLVKGRAVACSRTPAKSDGPAEANCRVGDTDVAEQLVRQGWARAAEQPEERFVIAEAAAKKQKLGIWRE